MHWWWGHTLLVPYVMLMFLMQGLAAVFELLYHAHFWQREYAIMHTATLLLEIACTGFLLHSTQDYYTIVTGLFLNKAIGSGLLILLSCLLLPILYKRTTLMHVVPTNQTKEHLKHSFIKYSLFMWMSTTIKSLSERNFLIPLFTYTLGAPIANMFKVANDAALIFQRTLLRTLGSADMSLLSYALLADSHQQLFQAFSYLVRTIIILTFPLATMTLLITKKFHTLATTDLMILFSIIMSGYIIEMLLSPYERLLEVEFKLTKLFVSYIPYIIGYSMLIATLVTGNISIIPYVGLTQIIRIVSSLCMVWYGYSTYQQPFPTALLYKVAGTCLLILGATWFIL